MPRALYTLLYGLLLPLILVRLYWRGRANPGYRQRTLERFGLFKPPEFDRRRPVIWLHAVSVGETVASAPLVKALQTAHPDWQWLITTTTPTGSDQVRRSFGDSVAHVYAPYDLPGFVRAFLRRCAPDLVIVMETELWPNLLHTCKQHTIPVVVANARLSEKSARGYGRLAALTRQMLNNVSVLACQQHADGERFAALGLARDKLHITGSIKFDIAIDDATRRAAAALRARWQPERPLWIAASTHPGEDEQLLDAFARVRRQHPRCLLLLVPRHPERFQTVHDLAVAQSWQVLTRSSGQAATETTDVIIGDSMGELMALYGCADIAFVGGSLVPVGGHNLIEPAYWQLPLISGAQLFNFTEVAALLQDHNALTVVSDAEALATCVSAWLDDPQQRREHGQRALAVAESNRGALAKLCVLIEACITRA